MLVNLIRDEPLMPIVQQHFGALRDQQVGELLPPS